MKKLTATLCLIVALVLHYHSVISEEYKTINTREGVTILFIKNTPSNDIRASAILLAGGNGDNGIDVEMRPLAAVISWYELGVCSLKMGF